MATFTQFLLQVFIKSNHVFYIIPADKANTQIIELVELKCLKKTKKQQ